MLLTGRGIGLIYYQPGGGAGDGIALGLAQARGQQPLAGAAHRQYGGGIRAARADAYALGKDHPGRQQGQQPSY